MVSAGLVLLHDEHACGHASDRELLVALEAGGARLGWPQLLKPCDELSERGGRSLGMDPQSSVVKANPTLQAELERPAPHAASHRGFEHASAGDLNPFRSLLAHSAIISG